MVIEIVKMMTDEKIIALFPAHSKVVKVPPSKTKKVATGNDMFKINNRNSRTRCEISSNLIIKTPERRHWRCSGVFIVNFEHISHLVLVFLLLTLSR